MLLRREAETKKVGSIEKECKIGNKQYQTATCNRRKN